MFFNLTRNQTNQIIVGLFFFKAIFDILEMVEYGIEQVFQET
jgi:hypothetical protein